jgi:hypothetical protein
MGLQVDHFLALQLQGLQIRDLDLVAVVVAHRVKVPVRIEMVRRGRQVTFWFTPHQLLSTTLPVNHVTTLARAQLFQFFRQVELSARLRGRFHPLYLVESH